LNFSTLCFAKGVDCKRLVAAATDLFKVHEVAFSRERLEVPGQLVGNLMAAQAAFRDLAPGESRGTLVAKCLTGIPSRPHLAVDLKMRMFLKRLIV
jgi:hypothetical protein